MSDINEEHLEDRAIDKGANLISNVRVLSPSNCRERDVNVSISKLDNKNQESKILESKSSSSGVFLRQNKCLEVNGNIIDKNDINTFDC